jgi:RNA polymerase sigma-70 factor (ECF subfamily)
MNAQTVLFADIYDAHAEEIYNFLYYKTFDRSTAEDLTSTTFLKALEHFPKFKSTPGASARSWLYKIARNTVIDYYRTKKKDLHIDETWDIADTVSLHNSIETKLKLEHVLQKLQELPEKDQELLIMRLWQGLSFKEISLVLEKSEASVKMAFSRGLKILRQSLITVFILLPLLWK